MNKKKFLMGVIAMLTIILFNGCSAQIDEVVDVSSIETYTKSTSVSLDYAKFIATNFDMSYKPNVWQRSSVSSIHSR
jgi:PBP1b-binding outer membrane lipoprotein LpoB